MWNKFSSQYRGVAPAGATKSAEQQSDSHEQRPDVSHPADIGRQKIAQWNQLKPEEKKIRWLTQEIKDLSNQLHDLPARVKGEDQPSERQIASLEYEHAGLSRLLGDLQDNLGSKNRPLSNNPASVHDLENKVLRLETALKSYNTQIAQLQQDKNDLSEQLRNHPGKADQPPSETTFTGQTLPPEKDLQKAVDTWSKRYLLERGRNDRLEGQLKTLEPLIVGLTDENANLTRQLRQLQDKVQEVLGSAASTEGTLHESEKAFIDLQALVAELESFETALNEQRDFSEEKRMQVEEINEEQVLQIHRLEKDLAAAEARAERDSEPRKCFESDLRVKTILLADAREQIARLGSESDEDTKQWLLRARDENLQLEHDLELLERHLSHNPSFFSNVPRAASENAAQASQEPEIGPRNALQSMLVSELNTPADLGDLENFLFQRPTSDQPFSWGNFDLFPGTRPGTRQDTAPGSRSSAFAGAFEQCVQGSTPTPTPSVSFIRGIGAGRPVSMIRPQSRAFKPQMSTVEGVRAPYPDQADFYEYMPHNEEASKSKFLRPPPAAEYQPGMSLRDFAIGAHESSAQAIKYARNGGLETIQEWVENVRPLHSGRRGSISMTPAQGPLSLSSFGSPVTVIFRGESKGRSSLSTVSIGTSRTAIVREMSKDVSSSEKATQTEFDDAAKANMDNMATDLPIPVSMHDQGTQTNVEDVSGHHARNETAGVSTTNPLQSEENPNTRNDVHVLMVDKGTAMAPAALSFDEQASATTLLNDLSTVESYGPATATSKGTIVHEKETQTIFDDMAAFRKDIEVGFISRNPITHDKETQTSFDSTAVPPLQNRPSSLLTFAAQLPVPKDSPVPESLPMPESFTRLKSRHDTAETQLPEGSSGSHHCPARQHIKERAAPLSQKNENHVIHEDEDELNATVPPVSTTVNQQTAFRRVEKQPEVSRSRVAAAAKVFEKDSREMALPKKLELDTSKANRPTLKKSIDQATTPTKLFTNSPHLPFQRNTELAKSMRQVSASKASVEESSQATLAQTTNVGTNGEHNEALQTLPAVTYQAPQDQSVEKPSESREALTSVQTSPVSPEDHQKNGSGNYQQLDPSQDEVNISPDTTAVTWPAPESKRFPTPSYYTAPWGSPDLPIYSDLEIVHEDGSSERSDDTSRGHGHGMSLFSELSGAELEELDPTTPVDFARTVSPYPDEQGVEMWPAALREDGSDSDDESEMLPASLHEGRLDSEDEDETQSDEPDQQWLQLAVPTKLFGRPKRTEEAAGNPDKRMEHPESTSPDSARSVTPGLGGQPIPPDDQFFESTELESDVDTASQGSNGVDEAHSLTKQQMDFHRGETLAALKGGVTETEVTLSGPFTLLDGPESLMPSVTQSPLEVAEASARDSANPIEREGPPGLPEENENSTKGAAVFDLQTGNHALSLGSAFIRLLDEVIRISHDLELGLQDPRDLVLMGDLRNLCERLQTPDRQNVQDAGTPETQEGGEVIAGMLARPAPPSSASVLQIQDTGANNLRLRHLSTVASIVSLEPEICEIENQRTSTQALPAPNPETLFEDAAELNDEHTISLLSPLEPLRTVFNNLPIAKWKHHRQKVLPTLLWLMLGGYWVLALWFLVTLRDEIDGWRAANLSPRRYAQVIAARGNYWGNRWWDFTTFWLLYSSEGSVELLV